MSNFDVYDPPDVTTLNFQEIFPKKEKRLLEILRVEDHVNQGIANKREVGALMRQKTPLIKMLRSWVAKANLRD